MSAIHAFQKQFSFETRASLIYNIKENYNDNRSTLLKLLLKYIYQWLKFILISLHTDVCIHNTT